MDFWNSCWSTVIQTLSGDRLRPELKQGDQGPQKSLQPPEQEGEVVSGGGQDGVEGVALLAGEVVAAHAVFVLDVADMTLASVWPS